MGMFPLVATLPIPLLMVADAALEEFQVKVAVAPAITVVGEAESETDGATTGVATKPTQPVNQAVIKINAVDANKRDAAGQESFMRL
jgi:hypothetical protein